MLGFRRLDVYRCAVRLLALAAALAERIPRGYGPLSDPLRRASLSILLNLAEGTGKPGQDAARFYAIARGSAMECAAILDAMETLGFVLSTDLAEPHDLLERIVSMLTKLIG